MNLTVNRYNNTIPSRQKISFKSTLYSSLKHLPNTPCACCGKKVINPEALSEAWANITRPLWQMIKEGKMNAWQKTPEIWEKIKLFAEFNPQMSLDRMLRNQNAFMEMKILFAEIFKPKGLVDETPECKAADKKVDDLFASMINHSRKDLKKSGEVMRALEPFKECLKGPRADAFKQFQIYAQKYPDKTLTEIVQLDEVFKFHHAKSILQANSFREEREYHFKRIEKHLEGFNEEYFAKVKEFALSFYDTEIDTVARREKIKELYKFALEQYEAEDDIKEKVFAEIDEMPMEFHTADSLFVRAKLHGFNDINIVNSFFSKALCSYEHIIPVSKEGKNSIYNGLILCRSCNENRGSKPYSEYVSLHPEMKENIKKQMKHITVSLENGELGPLFEFYPVMMAPFLKTQSSELDVHEEAYEYAKKRLERGNPEKESSQKRLKNLKSKKERAIKKQVEIINAKNEGKLDAISTQNELEKIKNNLSELNKQIDEEQRIFNRASDVVRVMTKFIKEYENNKK